MSRIKIVVPILFAVFAVSAMAVSSASAEWLVGGTKLVGSAALATTALVDEPTKLLVPTIQDLTIECTGEVLDGENPRIEAPDKGFASSLKFLACNTTKPASGCALEVVNQPITTLPILALVVLGKGEEDRVTFTPETKSTFATFKFSESNTCAFNGEEAVKGSVTIGAPTGQLDLLTQAIVGLGSVENNSLEIGTANKAFLIGGKALLKLANDATWSFM